MSLNVRGLRNQAKRRSIFRFLKDQIASFTFCKKFIQNQAMKPFGGVSGEVTFSLHTAQFMVEVFV